MSQIMNYVEYLSKEIGPRPAGTEEEQQAALYITEQFQKEGGFTTNMEEFSNSSNTEAGLAVLAAVAVAATVLAIIFPVLIIPAFILAAAAAVVYSLESFDRPVLSRVLSRGASQNVVAKYNPGGDAGERPGGRARSRKIILVAHYDTGRVTPAFVTRLDSLGLPIGLICVGGMVAAAFFLLIRIFIASGGGMGLLVLNVLSIVAAVICLLPIVKALLVRSAPYNEGAVNNATGTATLLEVARRIARGSVSEAELADQGGDVVIHGEAAAREAGLVPVGAQIRYEAEQLAPPSEIGEYSEEERLLSAKAAIAALTGKPIERHVYRSVAENLVNSHAEELSAEDSAALLEQPLEARQESPSLTPIDQTADGFPPASDAGAAPEHSPAGKADGFENAPSWFIAAQQNARKTERYNADEGPQIKRSRYTEAIESAERGFADREEELRAAEQAAREAEVRARQEELMRAREQAAEQPEQQPEPEPASGVEGSPEALGLLGQQSEQQLEPQLQSPNGTVAMPAPIPSSEILAELALGEQANNASALQAEPETASEPAAQGRIAKLPAIDPANPYSPAPTSNPSRSGILRKLRTNIPSLSGLIAPVPVEPQGSGEKPVAAAEAGGSSTAKPALAADAVPRVEVGQDRNAVEVPRSRSGNLINRLRKNGEEELSDTPQQWLNVDDDFEARSVGRARGSWESFRDDRQAAESAAPETRGAVAGEKPLTRRRWEGGAFSRVQLGQVDMRSGADAIADEPLPDTPPEATVNPSVTGEIEQIYHFRNPQFNTEVWFVAMGADGVSHDGARAFLEAHRDELRGSMIIEIESLGAGTLSVASDEGRVRKVTASSRVKRYTRSATAATGIAPDSVSLAGTDSIASTLQKAGYQTMHLFGAEDGRVALKGSADDVLENVDERALEEHVGFVFELLKG